MPVSLFVRGALATTTRMALAAALLVPTAPRAAHAQGVRTTVTDSGGRGTLRGTVFDSLAGAPLVEATVQVARAGDASGARTAVTDSLGRFRFDTLPAGRWMIAAYRPPGDALFGDSPAYVVQVPGGDSVAIALAFPSGATLRAALCPAQQGDSTAALVGVVREADADRLVEGATVSIAWTELAIERGGIHVVRRRVPATTNVGGVYLFCGVPADADVTVQATAPRLTSGEVDAEMRPGRLVRQDLALGAVAGAAAGDTAAGGTRLVKGSSRLAGVVRDDRGRPLAHAHVVVLGAAGRAETDDAGAFRLDSLPSGTWTVEARAIGFEPRRVAVTLAPQRPAEVRVAMSTRATVLDRVVVRGKQTAATSMLAEFLERKRTTGGTFITPAQIEQRHALRASELFWTVPGMRVVPKASGFGSVIRGRGGCKPAVYLDRMPIQDGADDLDEIVSANDLMAIEVYRDATVPAEFSLGNSGCGAVVLWTKR